MVLLTGCAIGVPGEPTGVSETGITLNAKVGSSIDGEMSYWFRYGPTAGYGTETPHRTLNAQSGELYPVGEPLTGLAPDSTYHWQLCARDAEEDPPRAVCSGERSFATVGDYVRGAAITGVPGNPRIEGGIIFDVASGAGGENPDGTVDSQQRGGPFGVFEGELPAGDQFIGHRGHTGLVLLPRAQSR